jgi:hypothetical protein
MGAGLAAASVDGKEDEEMDADSDEEVVVEEAPRTPSYGYFLITM